MWQIGSQGGQFHGLPRGDSTARTGARSCGRTSRPPRGITWTCQNQSFAIRSGHAMSTQRLLRRIELAEKTAKTQSVFAPHCICFPEDEQPEFRWRAEAEMAAEVLCPIHGIRFRIVVTRFLYRASW